MKQRPLVYIAGPYSRGDCVVNSRQAMDLWHELWSSGHVAPFCPHWSMFQHFTSPLDYEAWLDFDFQIIKRCDALLRMPGDSAGADREVQFADTIGIPVFNDTMTLFMWAKEWKP